MDKKATLRIVIAALIFMMLAAVIHGLSAQLTMGYYTDPQYATLWSGLMMPGGGPPGSGFIAFSLLFNFIVGFIYAYAYHIIKAGMPGGNYLKKGLNYGTMLFLVATVPFAFSSILLLSVPFFMVVVWALLDGFVLQLIAGILIARIVG